jgi:hypothetical protein
MLVKRILTEGRFPVLSSKIIQVSYKLTLFFIIFNLLILKSIKNRNLKI